MASENSGPPEVREIPGFYYDHVRRRYFKIQPGAFNASSSYTADGIKQRKDKERADKQKERIASNRAAAVAALPNLTRLCMNRQLGGGCLTSYLRRRLTDACAHLSDTCPLDNLSYAGRAGGTLFTSSDRLLSLDLTNTVVSRSLTLTSKPAYSCPPSFMSINAFPTNRVSVKQTSVPDLIELSPDVICCHPAQAAGSTDSRVYVLQGAQYEMMDGSDVELADYTVLAVNMQRKLHRIGACPGRRDAFCSLSSSSLRLHQLESLPTALSQHQFSCSAKCPCLAAQDSNIIYVCTNQTRNILAVDLRTSKPRLLYSTAGVTPTPDQQRSGDAVISSMVCLSDGYSVASSFLSGKLRLFDVRRGGFGVTQADDEVVTGPMGRGPQLRYDPSSAVLVSSANLPRVNVYNSRNLEKLAIIDSKAPALAEVVSRNGFPLVLLVCGVSARVATIKREHYFA